MKQRRFSSPLLSWIALTLAAGLFSACPAREPTPPEPEPVINQQLNLSFPALPTGFKVESNQAGDLRLALHDEERVGSMWVEVGERSDYGIDLRGIVNSQKALYEEKAGGSYAGGRKLVTPVGEAYYSRGRLDGPEGQVELTKVFLVHPAENRLVTFYYQYPAGDDSAERLPELFEWLENLEPASSPEGVVAGPEDSPTSVVSPE